MSITVFIIILTGAVSVYAWGRVGVVQKFIFSPYLVYRKKSFYRFITAGLIHQDLSHLFFNMLALYSFGETVEDIYRYYFNEKAPLFFIALYVGGLIVSWIPCLITYRHKPYYHTLGASGAVDAVIFTSILFAPQAHICIFSFLCLPSLFFGIGYIFYSYLSQYRFSQTNHLAHLAGSIYGILFNIALEPKVVSFFLYQVKSLAD